ESPDGLYICMNSFLGVGKRHLRQYIKKTKNDTFLHIKRFRKEIPKDESVAAEKPTKLAIGVEGGFQTEEKRFEFEEKISIVIPDKGEIAFPHESLPKQVELAATIILAAEDASKLEEAAAMAGTWEGEPLRVSKFADNLLQLNEDKKIPPSGWKCEKCDLTTNLWLNLTDGSILCGRRFFDGSGGNNHAVEHYQQVKHPLAVKLGTITATSGDVYSYAEDDMVEDPHLAKHLAHFGINVTALEKTDKTMTELEIDINQKIGEWDVIQEAGSQLKPCYGPGYTGMRNLGNSCYLNSVMQVVFSIPDFQRRYFVNADQLVQNAPLNPSSDFNSQMSKLAFGLLSGEYSKNVETGEETHSEQPKYLPPPQGIKPHMFKTLVGKGHAEFSTKKQQDAQEFFLHIISIIEKNSRDSVNPCDAFRFQVEERLMCTASKKVCYSRREDYCLSLPVPLEAAINKDEVRKYNELKSQAGSSYVLSDPESIIRPIIPLLECLSVFQESEPVEEFYSTAIQGKTLAFKTTRLASFPDFLMIQFRKFTVGDDWVPRKLDVSIQVPDELDLSFLRGHGLQSGEEELPAGDSPPEPPMEICEITVGQLADMGFPREGCRKAVFKTKNQGLEAALNWVMEHMSDPDFSDPLEHPAASKTFDANPEGIGMLMAMGFNYEQAVKALKATDNNTERAVDWIFSHADEISQPMETDETAEGQSQASKFKDGSEKYKLVAFISHMGTSTSVGHYVCHILKEGHWVIYNDDKVALSEHPPKDLAYLYLYQRLV
ncbi:Ubiquitin carboxyl-terminal hydrolase 5, partial [Bulinus truncatus]